MSKKEIELYVNKKFDVYKIIEMVFERKGWGEKYTLYMTPSIEILAEMTFYNFSNRYANFKLIANKKGDSAYETTDLSIYTEREDYTADFVNNLILKTIVSLLVKMRKNIFERESQNMFPYFWRSSKSDEEWIEEGNLQDEINEINNASIKDKHKEKLIDELIDDYVSEKQDREVYVPRSNYVDGQISSNRENEILDLISEIESELKSNDK